MIQRHRTLPTALSPTRARGPALAATLILVALAGGCSSSSDGADTDPSSAPSSTTSEPSAEATTAPAVSHAQLIALDRQMLDLQALESMHAVQVELWAWNDTWTYGSELTDRTVEYLAETAKAYNDLDRTDAAAVGALTQRSTSVVTISGAVERFADLVSPTVNVGAFETNKTGAAIESPVLTVKIGWHGKGLGPGTGVTVEQQVSEILNAPTAVAIGKGQAVQSVLDECSAAEGVCDATAVVQLQADADAMAATRAAYDQTPDACSTDAECIQKVSVEANTWSDYDLTLAAEQVALLRAAEL